MTSLTVQEALLARHDFPRALLDSLGSLVIVLDRAGHVVVYNRSCEQCSGHTAHAMLGRRFWDVVIPPEERAPVEDGFSRLAAGMFPSRHENDWLTAEGERRRIAWSNTCLCDASGEVEFVIGCGIDVTEERRMAAELALRSPVRPRSTSEGSAEVVHLLGAVSKELSESVNAELSLQRIAALVVDAVADFCAVYLLGEDGAPALIACADGRAPAAVEAILRDSAVALAATSDGIAGVRRVLRTGWPEQLTVGSGDGGALAALGLDWVAFTPMLAHGRTVGVTAVGLRGGAPLTGPAMLALDDVSRRCALAVENTQLLREARTSVRQLEAALAQTETLIHSAPIGLGLLDSDLRYVSLNDALARLHGKASEPRRGERFDELMRAEGPGFATILRGVLATGRPLINHELHLETEPGQFGDYLLTIYPVQTSRDERVGVGVAALDISAQKRAARERAVLEARLQQAQRMESVGLLAGGIAHDFNNLLVVVTTAGSLLAEELQGVPRAADLLELLHSILEAAERAAELTRNLLAFSRGRPALAEHLDLDDVISSMSRLLRRLIRESIQLVYVPAPQPLPVMADRGQLEQVLTNLCVNAAQAIADVGKIQVSCSSTVLDAAALTGCPWAQPGPFACITVEDDGAGIPRELHERMFEPFFTTKPVGQGTGLGLAIVYGIVKERGGLVRVTSEPGRGARFEVHLPLADGPAPTASVALEPVPQVGGTETILVVEDQELVARAVRRLLSKRGYQVIVAGDGEAACRVFDERHGEIKLVLLDAVLPRMSGHAVYEHLTARSPDLPILVLSGYTADVFPAHFFSERPVELISKPYDANRLLARIRKALDARDARLVR